MLDKLYEYYRISRIGKQNFSDCAMTALKLHVKGDGVSGYYIRDTCSQEVVFRHQGGSTLLTNNGKEWFFVKEGSVRLRYVTENINIRVIEELEVKTSDQFWNIGRELFYDKKLCDMTILLQDGQTIPAHKCILQAALPGLTGFSEQPCSSKDVQTVNLTDSPTEHAQEFIRAVYTRDIPKDPKLLISVGRLAGRYQDWQLLQKCCKELAAVLRSYPEYHEEAKGFLEKFPMVQSCLREAFLQAFESCGKSKINHQVSNYVGELEQSKVASLHDKNDKQSTLPNNKKEMILNPASSLSKLKRVD